MTEPTQSDREPVPEAGKLPDWIGRYGGALRAYFTKRVGSAEAEDLVQDVFVAMQARSSHEDIEHPNRYVFRIAANVLAARNRPNTWRWSDHADLDDLILADELSPERTLIAKETLERLMDGLRSVAPRAAEAFVLHRFDEMSYEEIARRMGIGVKAVEMHVRRTMERVNAFMEAKR